MQSTPDPMEQRELDAYRQLKIEQELLAGLPQRVKKLEEILKNLKESLEG